MRRGGGAGGNHADAVEPQWNPFGDYAMVCGAWTVGKFFLGKGRVKYGLWRGKETKAVGYFDSFDKAKEAADDH